MPSSFPTASKFPSCLVVDHANVNGGGIEPAGYKVFSPIFANDEDIERLASNVNTYGRVSTIREIRPMYICYSGIITQYK